MLPGINIKLHINVKLTGSKNTSQITLYPLNIDKKWLREYKLSFLGVQTVYTLECFHCYVKPPPRYKLVTFKLSINPWKHCLHIYIYRSPFEPAPEFEPLCSRFDGSDSFLVNCTQSTFCMTRTYRLQLRQGDTGQKITVHYGSFGKVCIFGG